MTSPKSENIAITVITMAIMVAVILIYFIVMAILTTKKVGDFALTDKQVLDKAQQCHKAGMAIQLVYDDEWQVYAVKCVEGGFTGEGRKK